MRVLLLGGTGLLGNHVWRQLLAESHEVTLLVRSADGVDWQDIDEEGRARTRVVAGSPLCEDTLRTTAAGCQALVNCVGCTDMSLLRYEGYLPANRDICTLLVKAMEATGAQSLVHVSTANTIGFGAPGQPADETAPMSQPFSDSFYARSKHEGEQILLRYAHERPERHVVVACPGFLIGRYDHKPSSGRLMLAAYRHPLMLCPSGGKSFVAARDVAAAVAHALTMGTSGTRYLLTGESLTLAEFYRMQASAMGYRQRVVVLPDWLALAAGRVGDLLRLAGVRTELCTRNVRQLLVREHYDSGRAHRELMMPRTPMEEAVREFFTDARSHRHFAPDQDRQACH